MRSIEVIGQEGENDSASFLPAPIRGLATAGLKKMMKNTGVTSLILSFTEKEQGNTIETKAGFKTVFFKGNDVYEDYKNILKENEIMHAQLKRAKMYEDFYRQKNNLPTRQQEAKNETK